MDPRIKQLATNIICKSVKLQKGENLWINACNPSSFRLAEALVEEAYRVGGLPYVSLSDSRVLRALYNNITREQAEFQEKISMEMIKNMNAYIGFSASENAFELSSVSSKNNAMLAEVGLPSLDYRVKNTKWCVLRWPTSAMAQNARMSTEEFYDFYFQSCLLDYSRMSKAMDALVDLMNKTDMVSIESEDTAITFSIKGIPAVKRDGEFNIPDGEVFTAPIRDSVNGLIQFNVPTIYEGKEYTNIYLEFHKGKMVNAKCEVGNNRELFSVLGRDEGARYIGEFAIGLNPYITKPMLSILFDEKICGSFHLTPGSCYDEAPNGNSSGIHWDMVCIQTPEYGGGTISFDKRVIRENGIFVLPELEALNPENLKK